MEFMKPKILAGSLVPILLGLSAETADTARRIYRRYGVVSHVFCDRLPLPIRLSLCMKFHLVHNTAGEQLMLHALLDFAAQIDNADLILCLIPCTNAAKEIIWTHRNDLESRFIITDKPADLRVLLGSEASFSVMGGEIK